jgi:hypothetical protein
MSNMSDSLEERMLDDDEWLIMMNAWWMLDEREKESGRGQRRQWRRESSGMDRAAELECDQLSLLLGNKEPKKESATMRKKEKNAACVRT